MGIEEENKVEETLDEEEKDEQDKEDEEEEREEKRVKAEKRKKEEQKSPGEALRELTSGKLKLLQPFRAHGQDVKEVAFDFCSLTNEEMMAALDTVPVNNMFAISNQQAMALFAATAAKCAPTIDEDDEDEDRQDSRKSKLYDARDIKKRMGPADSIKAVQLAKLFYNASSQAGGNNISKE